VILARNTSNRVPIDKKRAGDLISTDGRNWHRPRRSAWIFVTDSPVRSMSPIWRKERGSFLYAQALTGIAYAEV